MKKFRVRRTSEQYGVLEAETREEAVTLMKYGHHPVMWESLDITDYKYKLLDEIKNDDDNKS